MIALLWQKFYGYILAIGGALLAVIAVFYRGKSEGRNAERRDMAEQEVRDVKEILRQDAIVFNGDAARMRDRLSEALRRKRDSTPP